MVNLLYIILCASVTVTVYSEVINNQQDTYLDALEKSHQTTSSDVSRNSASAAADRGDISVHASPGYDYQPHQNYGPPAPVYGPPKPIYGPPIPPPPFFGHHHLAAFHHHPRDEHWFFDKFKFKLNLFTIGKILLKLIIFKKIVKFIGLICLLLFLPKLKNLFHEEAAEEDDLSMERRSFSTDKDNLNERIHEISDFALTAIETFSKKYEGCNNRRDQIWCRFQRMFDTIDHKYSYNKIVKLYIPNAKLDDVNENTI